MPNLLIRALPCAVLNALKRQASRNGRSLQCEVHAILGDAVHDAEGSSMRGKRPSRSPTEQPSAATLHLSAAPLVGKVGREEIYQGDR